MREKDSKLQAELNKAQNDYATARYWRNQSQSIRTISHHRSQEEQSLKTITK